MGSRNDYAVMGAAVEMLKEFGVAHEARIVSAHRTPDLLFDYANTAASRGLRVIIAGAGGAAHLRACWRRRQWCRCWGTDCGDCAARYGFAVEHRPDAEGDTCGHVGDWGSRSSECGVAGDCCAGNDGCGAPGEVNRVACLAKR